MARGLYHVGWKGWWWRFAIPAASATLAIEIVAQGLLVEAWLRAARYVLVSGPEARAVRRHHLIDQEHAPRSVTPEFEFRVGDDDPTRRGGVAAERIDLAAQALQLSRLGLAEDLAHPR